VKPAAGTICGFPILVRVGRRCRPVVKMEAGRPRVPGP
jgi:hypothetical protein